MGRYLSPKAIQEMYDIKKNKAFQMLKQYREQGGKVYKIGRLTRVYDEEFDEFMRKNNESTT